MCRETLLIIIFIISYQSTQSCSLVPGSSCAEILSDRYDMTVEEFADLAPLKQLMMQDSIDCADESLCPLTGLDPIINQTMYCNNGKSSPLQFPCHNVDLLSFLPLHELGANLNASGNDLWGWTQYNDNNMAIGYYALAGVSDGTSIVDITDALNPNVLAFIESNVNPLRNIIWRDIKTFADFVFVVADTGSKNDHSMQIFNITQIIANARQHQNTYGMQSIYNANPADIGIYTQFGKCHNIFINEDSAFLYAVGTNKCNGGLHIVDIGDPTNPVFVKCFRASGYIHDVQCVIYHGSDSQYDGHEICFAFAPDIDSLSIIDVTDKENMNELSRQTYVSSSYVHQGWLTGNHDWLLMDDELDENQGSVATQTTYIWNVKNLDNPKMFSVYDSGLNIIDHNQYIIDNGRKAQDGYKGFTFQSNYNGGLRVLNIDDVASGALAEIAYFDTYVWSQNTMNFRGSWSVFPYYKLHRDGNEYSDIIVSQNTNVGLFVLKLNIGLNDIFTAAPTINPTYEPTNVPTQNPTVVPSAPPTHNPSQTPTNSPSYIPTITPSLPPTNVPSSTPTNMPSIAPTNVPSLSPSQAPSLNPSISPSLVPTLFPTNEPTIQPTTDPTNNPTILPTIYPSNHPTANPTLEPTVYPTAAPTTNPTIEPTSEPTSNPTIYPTSNPTIYPTSNPTIEPTSEPTIEPTSNPTIYPTSNPTTYPTLNPSIEPTSNPTVYPTSNPTIYPTLNPTIEPTSNPTVNPIATQTAKSTTGTHVQSSSVSDYLDTTGIADKNIIENTTNTNFGNVTVVVFTAVFGTCLCVTFGFILIACLAFKRQVYKIKVNKHIKRTHNQNANKQCKV